MNKNAIKKFAIEARNKLRASVADKAGMLGITETGCNAAETKGIDFEVYRTAVDTQVTLNKKQSEQRRKLAEQIERRGYDAVIEEVAYTWFNRICAIRFMEVNDYLPTRVRVLSSEKAGKNDPDIVTAAPDIDLDLTEQDREAILDHKASGDTDWLFRMLFIKQCNKLSEILPELFEATEDYTEMLFNVSYTNRDDVIQMLIGEGGIPEQDFNISVSGQVEVIGWLYQYYNEERKNEVINIYKGTVKKEDIPAATQLFTTDWVVRYMVDNSLGRYWIERNPQSRLREKLEFFVSPKSGEINYMDKKIKPTELTFFDPCMGSGHILVYAFDVLMEIYRECGYSDRDAALFIVQNNLFGLDIDDRAYQLAYFAVMMKARSYNRRALTQGVCNHLCAIKESNGVNVFVCDGITVNKQQNEIGEYLLNTFKDAKELGSLISVALKDYNAFAEYLINLHNEGQISMFQNDWYKNVQPLCMMLVKQADILSRKYCVVATNPPYLGKMQGQLKKFVVENYKNYSGDLFAVFMYRNFDFCVKGGYSAFMTPFVWMFIKTYEKLREYIIRNKGITTLVQMEYSAFEEATVPICSFVLKNGETEERSLCIRLSDFKGGMEVQKNKVLEALEMVDCHYFYEIQQDNFSKIPGSPVAYWVSKRFIPIFNYPTLADVTFSDGQNKTGNNDKFLRFCWEVNKEYIGENKKWIQLAKGGGFRRWYGNIIHIIDWSDKARMHYRNDYVCRIIPEYIWYKSGITWGDITSYKPSFRLLPAGMTFETAGLTIFPNDSDLQNYILGLLNSCIFDKVSQTLNATIHTKIKDVQGMPLIIESKENVDQFVKKNIFISQTDWDSFETSWDFKIHPLVKHFKMFDIETRKPETRISACYNIWNDIAEERFIQLKANEEELNRIFIDIYGLQDELTPEVEDKDVTVRQADLSRDIRSLLSYAVGCMFGRYSVAEEGLIYAGGDFEEKYALYTGTFADTADYKMDGKYTLGELSSRFYYLKAENKKALECYKVDYDNIIPITDEEYFQDDIVGLFCDWLKKVYGADTLEENLDFIAAALGNKGGTSREVVRNYFLNDFMADHMKIYQKRPIYWLFDSGKANGFKALIYLHRYHQDTVGTVRTEYLHKTQKSIEQALERAEYISTNGTGSEKAKATKQITKYTKQLAEIRIYDEAMAHIANQRIVLDLDDGVKVNYAKFQGVEVAQEGKKTVEVDLLAKI